MTEKKANTATAENAPGEIPALPPVEQLLALKNEPVKKRVALDLIDFYPRNRKRFKPGAIEELAANIAIYDVLQDVILRSMPNDRYELVIGERRVRAARLAGKIDIPSKIYALTDSEAQRIRISENAFREDLHPMEEAYQVAELQQEFPTVDDIVRAVGKPKTWVFSRIRLNSLVESIQEMFLAEVFSFNEAFSIALIEAESQLLFYDNYCSRWKEEKRFRICELENKLNQNRYKLKDAQFNPRSKQLVPEAGACSSCPHNTAYVSSFFPDEEKSAVCLKKSCFEQKTEVHFKICFTKAMVEFQPAALIFGGAPPAQLLRWMEAIPGASDLPRLDAYSIQVLREPDQPDQKDYKTRLAAYEAKVKHPDVKPALYVAEGGCEAVYYRKEAERPTACSSNHQTARDIENAIKAGVATEDQVKAQIAKSKAREVRDKELDQEKIQEKIHLDFSEQLASNPTGNNLTSADQAAARWLIFSQLPYDAKDVVLKRLFPRPKDRDDYKAESMFEKFTTLDKSEHIFLIRLAMVSRSGSKYLKHPDGFFLAKVAEGAKLNVKAIQEERAAIAQGRQERRKTKISKMHQYLKKKSA